jgi:hypothetical protein
MSHSFILSLKFQTRTQSFLQAYYLFAELLRSMNVAIGKTQKWII